MTFISIVSFITFVILGGIIGAVAMWIYYTFLAGRLADRDPVDFTGSPLSPEMQRYLNDKAIAEKARFNWK